MTLQLEERRGMVCFRVKVQARARRKALAGVQNGVLRLRVTEPPLEGRANAAVVALLAEHLRLPRSSIKIASGERAPVKLVEVAGLGAPTVLKRLRLRPASGNPSGPE